MADLKTLFDALYERILLRDRAVGEFEIEPAVSGENQGYTATPAFVLRLAHRSIADALEFGGFLQYLQFPGIVIHVVLHRRFAEKPQALARSSR